MESASSPCNMGNRHPPSQRGVRASHWPESGEDGAVAKEKGRKLVAQNRKARHDYHIRDTYEAGIVLSGTEVKSLREGRANLADAYATVDDGEVWLRAAHIPEYSHGTWTNHTARRNRKLLLNRKEITRIEREPGDGRAPRWCRWRSTSPTGTPRSRSPWPPASGTTTSGRASPSGSPSARPSGRWRPGTGASDVRLTRATLLRPALRRGRHPRHHHAGVRGRRPDRRVRDHLRGPAQRHAPGDREDRLAVRRQLRPARHPALHRHPRAVRRDEDAVYRITNIDVTSPDPGVSTQWKNITDEFQDGREEHTRLRIGDPDETISADTATYVISYDLTGAMRSFADYDEFFWDASGFENPLIKQLTITATRARRRPGRLLLRRAARQHEHLPDRGLHPGRSGHASPRATSRPVRASRSASRSRPG